MDTLSREARSERMRRVKSSDTKPELELRRLVWSLGYRYRRNRPGIPGRPDLAFVARRRAIFLHGCFWHRHRCHSGSRTPKTRRAFWQAKFKRNVKRDGVVARQLRTSGWHSLVIWECELADTRKVEHRVRKFLNA